MNPDLPAPAALLSARGLRYSRNDEPVFGPLDFDVHAGEALLVLGGNGAGKTTLLRVLAGLLALSEGRVELDGAVPTREKLALSMSYLSHHLGHKADLSALENLRFSVGLGGKRPRITEEMALASVGLSGHEDTPARRLSAGQKKRLSLARLLLVPARLWLLDEPYANLDLGGITLVNRLVQKHLGEGGAAMITTHGAYAAPPVRTRTLSMDGTEAPDV